MAITLPSGFRITNNEPGDSRVVVASQAARLGFSAANVFKGMLVFQQDTQELYVLINNASPSSNSSWVRVFATNGVTGSFSGSFIGNGAGLVNLPASSIVGLNLTQIADSQVSASVSATGTSFTVSSASIDLLTVNNQGLVSASLFSGSFQGPSTGSFTGIGSGSFSGSFQGNGNGLTDVPASSIVGLNLSLVSTGSVTASTAPNGTVFQITSGSSTLLSLNNLGDLTVSASEFIGNNLTAVGNASITGSLTAKGNTNLEQNLTVGGTTTFLSNAALTGSLQISQNLTVQGTASFGYLQSVSGSAKIIGDAFIILNADVPAERYAGLIVIDSGSTGQTGSLLYDAEQDHWFYESTTEGYASGFIAGARATRDNIVYPNRYAITRGDGGNHIVNSNIYSTGSNVTINKGATGSLNGVEILGSLEVTGSLNLTGSVNITNQISASTVLSQYSNIGLPEDGTYTDGLYTDVTDSTYVGTMIDRFNEVLKGLSPSPAPDLDNLEGVTSTGINSIILGFGAAASTSSYSNVTGTGSLSAVNFTGTFLRSTGAVGGYLRMGTFSATTTLSIRLNNDVDANGTPFVNYPADSFNVPTAGGESYTLEINGNTYTETPSGTNSLSGTYFTLTAAATGFFPATGLPFAIFRNRQGTVSIPAGLWRNGWNFIRVRQGSNITNFVDWVYDPAAASGNFAYVFNNFTTSSVSPTGEKALSGIKYYTGFSYNVTGSITNYYKNVYNTSAKSFSSVSSGVTAGSVSIPTPTTVEDLIQVNSSHTLAASGYRLLNQTLTSTLNVSNDFGKSGGTGAITTPTILLDNINTANTTIAENFCLEDRRVPSASYDTQISATNAIGTFPSASALGSSELAVYNGTLRYPTQVLNSGNVSGAGVFYAISGQPNYSAASGTRYFYRVFTNGASQLAGWSITINGTSTSFVSFGTALTGNNMRIGIKVPGVTGYRDMLTAAPGAGTYTPTADGVGCQSGGAISLGTAGALSLVSERLPANQVFVLRLEVGSSWTGTISSISITGF
jgi:hypothetical protein